MKLIQLRPIVFVGLMCVSAITGGLVFLTSQQIIDDHHRLEAMRQQLRIIDAQLDDMRLQAAPSDHR